MARYELKKRNKELKTIYWISAILQDDTQSLDVILKRIVAIIPKGWQNTHLCSARIVFDGKEYFSSNYKVSKVKQSATIKTLNNKIGVIEVYYDLEIPAESNPFLKEEYDLINTLSEIFTVYYNKKTVFNELKKSEANLNSVFENSDVGHLLLDENMKIISFNTPFQENYLEASGIEIKKNDTFYDVLLSEKREDAETVFSTIRKTKKRFVYETEYKLTNKVFFFNISISPILEENRIIGFCISAIDITTGKLMGIERQSIIEELMQRNRDLEQFAYIVSHNIRSPLTNILGISQFLNNEFYPEEDKQLLRGIQNAAKNLDAVLCDLNLILRVRRENNENKEIVILEDLVEEVKNSISNSIENSKAIITYNFESIASIVSIKSFIQNIFYNLIINSIKYTQQNVVPQISIWSEIVDDNVVLHFKDNGIGIDLKRYGNQVFGLYKRFNLNIEGKGLGLFMVKTQIKALNGSIEIKSEINLGTHFILTFPKDTMP